MSIVVKLEGELAKQLEQFNSLKRGVDIVIESTRIVNDLDAKHIELGLQSKPKILPDKTKLTPGQIEAKKLATVNRAKFLLDTRSKVRPLELTAKENQDKRAEVISTVKKICSTMSVACNDLEKAVSSKALRSDLQKLMDAAYRKKQYFTSGYAQLVVGLDCEELLEERAVQYLEGAVSAFGKSQSVSRYMDDMGDLHGPFLKTHMVDKITLANELIDKAMAVEVSVKSYLAGAD